MSPALLRRVLLLGWFAATGSQPDEAAGGGEGLAFALRVTRAGDGTGAVISSPSGIECGPDCSASFAAGTTVTFSAFAVPGARFVGWTGANCSGVSQCTITLSGPLTVGAAFALDSSLVVMAAGSGSGTVTSSPAGINCGADCSEAFPAGTGVTLVAIPDVGSTFGGWGNGCSGAGACTLTVEAAAMVTANFALEQFPLWVATTGAGTGRVTSSPPGVDCGEDCNGLFELGTAVTLTALAGPGSTFAGWKGASCSGAGPCTPALTAATAVVATFERLTYPVTVSRAGSGTGVVTAGSEGLVCGEDCTEQWAWGTEVVLTATPAEGSSFAGWSGGPCTGPAPCRLTVAAATHLTASFTLETQLLTAARSGTGVGTIVSFPAGIDCGTDCSEPLRPGTVVTLTANAAQGSLFAGWTGSGCTGVGKCILTLWEPASVVATFQHPTYTLSVERAGGGKGTVTSSPAGISCGPDCTLELEEGAKVVLAAFPAPGSAFFGWAGGCGGAGECPVTISAPTGRVATFNLIFKLGNPTRFAHSSIQSPDLLQGQQLYIARPLTLRQLGLIATAGGPKVKLALYTDARGAPGTLVAQTAATPMVPGAMALSPTAGLVTLPAGTYWIVGIFSGRASIGATTGTTPNRVSSRPLPFGSELPGTFGPAKLRLGQSFNYYLVAH